MSLSQMTSRLATGANFIQFSFVTRTKEKREKKKLLKTTQCRDMAASNHLPCRKQSPNNPNRGKSIKGHEGEIGGKENKR